MRARTCEDVAVIQSSAQYDGVRGPWCCAWELAGAEPVVGVVPRDAQDTVARVLVRLHGEPLGHLDAPCGQDGVDVSALRQRALAAFSQRVRSHLLVEGLSSDVDAVVPTASSACPNAIEADRTVTVVVCTRSRSELLESCLEHLGRLTYERLDILVVDNAPTDDSTRATVARWTARDPRVAYAVATQPGLSAARNRGLSEAKGDVVAFTDDDVWVDSDWVHGLVRGFRRRPDVGCVTGLVGSARVTTPAEAYFDARTASWSGRMVPDLFDLTQARGPLYPYSAGVFGTGANFAVTRGVMLDLGGFDVALGAGTATRGGEDLDAFVRLLRAGVAIAYEPSALVWHHHRADDEALNKQMFGYGSGLSAYLTKCVLDRSARVEVFRRVLPGVRRLVSLHEQTQDRLPMGTARPAGVTRHELLGALAGPLLYARSRRAVRSGRAG